MKSTLKKHFSSSTKTYHTNLTFNQSLKFNPYTQPDQFLNEYSNKHASFWRKYCKPFNDLGYSGFRIGWFNTERDSELGAGRWNCNGVYPNKLSNILFRSKTLQTSRILDLYIRLFGNRSHGLSYNIAESQPGITTNSVFLYKDPSNFFVNRRGFERLFVSFFLVGGLNFSGVLLYLYIGWFFSVIPRIIHSTNQLVFRMDLIPETEQFHIIKIGFFGFQRSILVDIKDIEKIHFEEDLSYPDRWYKSIIWKPRESREMVYRNRQNEEVFTFSKFGVWNRKGIEHELIA